MDNFYKFDNKQENIDEQATYKLTIQQNIII